jgi:hypothetical protein
MNLVDLGNEYDWLSEYCCVVLVYCCSSPLSVIPFEYASLLFMCVCFLNNQLENKKDAFSIELQQYCLSQPVCVIRGLAGALKLGNDTIICYHVS